ncbi:FecCD family ABC transporter permease [Spirochaeta cellobiosiphila]|uniref:FecCD family ABC transporter permease n=1 Tax=Spirochaeta cellobiosiphila TaxID=504483 RepID=UPI000565AC38|nr:iron ABC transporter permease [Spirochaeta cellobiosiphila]
MIKNRKNTLFFFVILLFLLSLCCLVIGSVSLSWKDVYESLVSYDSQSNHQVILRTIRAPRVLSALLVGAALGIAGSIIQALTRNPLADPGLLGVNMGSSLGIVIGIYYFSITNLNYYIYIAFLGALFAGCSILLLGSLGQEYSGRNRILNTTIAGAIVKSLLSSLTTAFLILNQRTYEEVRFWLAGSLGGRDMSMIGQLLPFILIGLFLALLITPQLTTLSLGDSVAKSVGQNTLLIQIYAFVAVIILSSVSVALAGPIGFVGLVIPHVVRFFVGHDYKWVVPYSAIVGAGFLLFCDLLSRTILRPIELPVGVVTALIGGPIFIFLIQKKVSE